MKNKGEKKQKAARGRSMRVNSTQSRKGVKGQLPLAGSRDSVPCGVWGNAPTVFRALNSKGVANKGAGSEASLPVTSRVLRRAPKLLIRLTVLCRAKWRDQTACLSDVAGLFRKQGISRLRARVGGFAVAPDTPSQCTPMFLGLYCCRGFRLCGGEEGAMKTDEVCGRPLETFGAATFGGNPS